MTMEHVFRKAALTDIDRIMEIIGQAKAMMARLGRRQWDGSYPLEQHISTDIENGNGYVICHGGKVVAYGAVVFTGEEAYRNLRGGTWLSEGQYVVLHRLAVAEEARCQGFAGIFLKETGLMAIGKDIHSFKVDTNHDNSQMLHILESEGFSYCGKIHYHNGERMAFEKPL